MYALTKPHLRARDSVNIAKKVRAYTPARFGSADTCPCRPDGSLLALGFSCFATYALCPALTSMYGRSRLLYCRSPGFAGKSMLFANLGNTFGGRNIPWTFLFSASPCYQPHSRHEALSS